MRSVFARIKHLLTATAGCVKPYTRNLAILSRRRAIRDVDCLVTNVKAMHADPFTRVDEATFDACAEHIRAELPGKVSRKELAMKLAGLLALIGDTHTFLDLSKDYRAYTRGEGKVFPFEVRYIDRQSVAIVAVAEGLPHPGIHVGERLLAINGVSVSEIFERARVCSFGETDEIRDMGTAAHLALAIWYGGGEIDQFTLKLRGTDGWVYETRVPAAASPSPALGGWSDRQHFNFRFYENGRVCLLRADSFDSEYRQRFSKLLDEMLGAMREKGSEVLVVDVSRNGGGNTVLAIDLLRRTVERPFKEGQKRWRCSRAYQVNMLKIGLHRRGVPSWLLLHRILRLKDYLPGFPGRRALDGEYHVGSPALVRPNENPWPGKLVVVCGPATHSAATDFTAIVKDNGLGLIVGEETGGRATYFSEVGYLLLPSSGLVCGIATARWTRPAGYDDGRGVLPDVTLDVTVEESSLVNSIVQHLRHD